MLPTPPTPRASARDRGALPRDPGSSLELEPRGGASRPGYRRPGRGLRAQVGVQCGHSVKKAQIGPAPSRATSPPEMRFDPSQKPGLAWGVVKGRESRAHRRDVQGALAAIETSLVTALSPIQEASTSKASSDAWKATRTRVREFQRKGCSVFAVTTCDPCASRRLLPRQGSAFAKVTRTGGNPSPPLVVGHCGRVRSAGRTLVAWIAHPGALRASDG